MRRFPCPYLNAVVELTEERERHIAERHPDLLPKYLAQVAQVLADPDEVRRSQRFGMARLFARWFDSVRSGKYVVVVVVSEPSPRDRHWIVTAYMARGLAGGGVEWKRN